MPDEKPPADQRPKRLADVPRRFPPPPGTRFYVCFKHAYEPWPPYEEMVTVVVDSPQAAIEQVIREGVGPTDPSRQEAFAVWFDHNGRPRVASFDANPSLWRGESGGR